MKAGEFSSAGVGGSQSSSSFGGVGGFGGPGGGYDGAAAVPGGGGMKGGRSIGEGRMKNLRNHPHSKPHEWSGDGTISSLPPQIIAWGGQRAACPAHFVVYVI